MSTHQTALTIGNNQRYTLKHRLGEGGMGSVYLAYDGDRDCHIALKKISRCSAANIYRLKNEFRSLADITHPNLVTLYELISEGDDWFITMELIDGFGYYDFVFGNESPSDPCRITITDSSPTIQSCRANILRLRSVLAQLSRAIYALHEAGKLHRDIKPSNIMVTREARVVVLDFGLVRENPIFDIDRSLESDLLGTPAYMSPEQAAGHPLSTASDWYSLGAMLYETLTGRLPFEGSVLDIMQEKVLHDPVPPSSHTKEIPDDLDELCVQLLSRFPEDRPTGEEIIEWFTGSPSSLPAFRAQSSPPPKAYYNKPLIGRQNELQALYDAFEAVQDGNPITVYVHGSSGIGKTALIQRFLFEVIEDKRAIVLKGRCFERESVPYKALDNVVDSLTRYLSHLSARDVSTVLPRDIHSLAVLFPVLQKVTAVAESKGRAAHSADPCVLRSRAFSAFKEFLQRLSDTKPVIMVVEDLHWGDVDSAQLLLEILGPPDPPPILLIGSYRSDEIEISPFLNEVMQTDSYGAHPISVRNIALERLEMFEAQQMAQQILDELTLLPSELAQKIAEEADRIPIFIAELARYAKAHKAADGSIPPTSLEQVVVDRVACLPDEARRLLEIFAVAARPTEQAVALFAAGLPPGDRAPLVKLRNARLIRSRGPRNTDTAETYHSRISDAVVRNLTPRRLKECHLALAQAIMKSGIRDSERLITYFRGAGRPRDAGAHARTAAEQAASKLAFNRAAELFQTAIELLPASERQYLYPKLGDALANSGQGAKAAEAYLQAMSCCSDSEKPRYERLATTQFLRSGRVEQGTFLTKKILSDVGIQMAESSREAILSIIAHKLLLRFRGYKFHQRALDKIPLKLRSRLDALGAVYREMGAIDPLMGILLQTQYLECALKAGDPLNVLEGLAWEAIFCTMEGPKNSRRVQSLWHRIDELAASINIPYAYGLSKMVRASCLFFLGRYEEVEQQAQESERIFQDECTGASWEIAYLTAIRYGAAEKTGCCSIIAHGAPQKAREARERDDQFTQGFLLLSVSLTHLMNDDPMGALHVVKEHESRITEGFNFDRFWVVLRTVDIMVYMNKKDEVIEYINRQLPILKKSGVYRAPYFKLLSDHMYSRALLCALDDPWEVQKIKSVSNSLKSSNWPEGKTISSLINGTVAWKQNKKDLAKDLLVSCIKSAKSTCPALSVFARYCLGVVTGGLKGKLLIDEAISSFTVQGVQNPERWVRMISPGFPRPRNKINAVKSEAAMTCGGSI